MNLTEVQRRRIDFACRSPNAELSGAVAYYESRISVPRKKT
jgi:hypothetical protein